MLSLAWEGSGAVDAAGAGPWESTVSRRPGLLLVDSEASRSVVCHALEHHLPASTALLVTPLAAAPEMKGCPPAPPPGSASGPRWARSSRLSGAVRPGGDA